MLMNLLRSGWDLLQPGDPEMEDGRAVKSREESVAEDQPALIWFGVPRSVLKDRECATPSATSPRVPRGGGSFTMPVPARGSLRAGLARASRLVASEMCLHSTGAIERELNVERRLSETLNETVTSLQERVEALTEEAQIFQGQNATLYEELESERSSRERAEKTLRVTTNNEMEMLGTMQEMEQLRAQNEHERAELARQLEAERDAAAEATTRLQAECSVVEASRREISGYMDALRAAETERKRLNDDLLNTREKHRAAVVEASRQLKEAQDAADAKLRRAGEVTAELEARLEEALRARMASTAAAAAASADARDAAAFQSATRAELERCARARDESEALLAQAERNLNEERERASERGMLVANLERAKVAAEQGLRSSSQDLKRAVESLRRAKAESTERIALLRARGDALAQELEALRAASAQDAELRSKLAEVEAALRAESADHRRSAEAKMSLEVRVDELEQRNADLGEEAAALRARVEELTILSESQKGELDSSMSEIQELQHAANISAMQTAALASSLLEKENAAAVYGPGGLGSSATSVHSEGSSGAAGIAELAEEASPATERSRGHVFSSSFSKRHARRRGTLGKT